MLYSLFIFGRDWINDIGPAFSGTAFSVDPFWRRQRKLQTELDLLSAKQPTATANITRVAHMRWL